MIYYNPILESIDTCATCPQCKAIRVGIFRDVNTDYVGCFWCMGMHSPVKMPSIKECKKTFGPKNENALASEALRMAVQRNL